jgi:hypothetical protein
LIQVRITEQDLEILKNERFKHMEMGLPGWNSSQTARPPSGLKAILQRRSSGPAPVVSVSRKMNMPTRRSLVSLNSLTT